MRSEENSFNGQKNLFLLKKPAAIVKEAYFKGCSFQVKLKNYCIEKVNTTVCLHFTCKSHDFYFTKKLIIVLGVSLFYR